MSGFAPEQAKPESAAALGVYVHVPFCASTCDFCAFYQVQPTSTSIEGFLQTVRAELCQVAWDRPVETVFWGGGTPGLLTPAAIERLGAMVLERTGGTPREWTVELAPSSVTAERLQALKGIGVTRVSMGVQSFQPALLEALGRLHSRSQVLRAYERIRAAGFASVNLDLMFALPGQTEAEWLADVREAVGLAPDHLSTYCLTFEEDTALWVKLSQGRVKLDPEHEARLYEATWDAIGQAGYAQYEVSNFARAGHECRHNLNTWRMAEWVGVGPSAASQHRGLRGANIADLAVWTERIGRGERVTEDRVSLTPALRAEDALVFGVRMNAGVDVALWKDRTPGLDWAPIDQTLSRLTEDGLAEQAASTLRLTRRGRLLADSVGLELMGAFDQARGA